MIFLKIVLKGKYDWPKSDTLVGNVGEKAKAF